MRNETFKKVPFWVKNEKMYFSHLATSSKKPPDLFLWKRDSGHEAVNC